MATLEGGWYLHGEGAFHILIYCISALFKYLIPSKDSCMSLILKNCRLEYRLVC